MCLKDNTHQITNCREYIIDHKYHSTAINN